MGDLYNLINDSELWELFNQLGTKRVLNVESMIDEPVIYIEISNEEIPVIDLKIWLDADVVPKGIIYQMHVSTSDGKLYETNKDTINAKKLKQSIKELVDYYGGLNKC